MERSDKETTLLLSAGQRRPSAPHGSAGGVRVSFQDFKAPTGDPRNAYGGGRGAGLGLAAHSGSARVLISVC